MSDQFMPSTPNQRSTSDPSPTGRGFRFPFGVDARGSISLASAADELDGSIRMIISTAPGERVMRAQFGCRIWDLLFEPVNDATIGLMARAVRDALNQWEPRANVESVDVVPDPADSSRVDIHVRYIIKTTNDKRNLVYPFYVIPREESPT